MSKPRIFIIDDEDTILKLIEFYLTKEGYDVSCFLTGESALKKIEEKKPDLILLDVMLKGRSGFEICRIIKRDFAVWNIPVILITARNDEFNIVTGFELGADDYITKPFSEKILLARIKAILRRKNSYENNPKLNFNGLVIDPQKHKVLVNGKKTNLTRSEIKLLYFLASNPGRVFERYKISEAIREDDTPSNDRSIDVIVVRIRKKIKRYGKYIETVYGVGYRFKELIEY